MASSFGRYTGGIEASTGNLVAASGQMAAQTTNALAGFGQNIAQGIEKYNENSAKSEAANAKIQMLGQEYSDKIAMYSKDPEIAQSGILDGLMAKAKMLQDAPTKGLSQRVMIAHDAETSLAGFGGRLQESMFLRGRQMEREAQMALDKFNGFKSVTQPAFAGDAEFQVDLNLTPQEAQAQALAKLNRIRKSNPRLQGTDEEFLSSWRTAREQALANAKDINPAVVSSGLEALQAERNNAKAQAEAQNKRDLSGVLAAKFWSKDAPVGAVGGVLNLPKFSGATAEQSQFLAPVGKTVASMKDYEKTVVSPVDQVNRKTATPVTVDNTNVLLKRREETTSKIKSIDEQIKSLTERIDAGKDEVPNKALSVWKNVSQWADQVSGKYIDQPMALEWARLKKGMGQQITPEYAEELRATTQSTWNKVMPQLGMPAALALMNAGVQRAGYETVAQNLTTGEENIIKAAFEKNKARKAESGTVELGNLDTGIPKTANELKTGLETRKRELQATLQTNDYITDTGAKVKAGAANKNIASVPTIPLGRIQVGTEEKIQRRTIAERQREVADFVTSRMGAIDPTDPERKRRLPVSGFDKFYKTLVPEAELREFTTDSGARMLYANGKWEQLKVDKALTMQDIRGSRIGIYGQQDQSGRLVPTEFVEGSGVLIGGMFNGTDAANDKYSEEMTNLIDARRGVKELQRINDLVGEAVMPVEQGRALVETMNLSAMLRTDIVGVGTVSNYEQELIKNVVRDPTSFFSLESKDRAILIALAQRVDRRIKSHSSSRGLTVIMKDDTGTNKYQALREQYLKEKGIF
jgi:hypothetical protein